MPRMSVSEKAKKLDNLAFSMEQITSPRRDEATLILVQSLNTLINNGSYRNEVERIVNHFVLLSKMYDWLPK